MSIVACSSLPPVSHPGIDKLTEKSQVSEDGTLRSLEPESQPSSVEGSPSEGVGIGDAWSMVLSITSLPFSLNAEV